MVRERYGESGIRIVFGDIIDEITHEAVRRFFLHLTSLNIPGIVDIIPSFRTCLVHFDSDRVRYEQLCQLIDTTEADRKNMVLPDVQRLEIPVRYGGDYGPDMDFVCSYSGLSPEEVIEIHSAGTYRVHAIGFMPGFPYLGPVDRRLYVPRQATPVLKVPQGSVGIAQLQTGIYPFESPAGWRIIGRTMMRLFDYTKPPYSVLHFGDTVRFVRV
ncbi:MAG: 5-oxoprolinase subunit PxpB [Syntrophorhabdaceae bacterium]|nr:5-oxoprolinase subunit PxpB [Syntrophorhabdaceae bacterium]HOC45594.1 5-oxoprolinase subunit PxpB [Syntrophorhabdaceae bacterium]